MSVCIVCVSVYAVQTSYRFFCRCSRVKSQQLCALVSSTAERHTEIQFHQLGSRYLYALLRVNDTFSLHVLRLPFTIGEGTEWVRNTVGSGNIWWARKPQKGSFKISRKQESVQIQDWAGYISLEGQTLVRVEKYYVCVWRFKVSQGKALKHLQYLTFSFSVRTINECQASKHM